MFSNEQKNTHKYEIKQLGGTSFIDIFQCWTKILALLNLYLTQIFLPSCIIYLVIYYIVLQMIVVCI